MGLTTLGLIHTVISLVAVFAGIYAFVRDKQIITGNTVGQIYLWGTILTCVTGFGIYEHGGFGAPHALGVITLVVLLIAWGAGTRGWFGKSGKMVEVVSYSVTFFFHMIPAITETTTRLPVGNPLVKDREGPELQAAAGVCLVLLLIGVFLQIRRLRAGKPAGAR